MKNQENLIFISAITQQNLVINLVKGERTFKKNWFMIDVFLLFIHFLNSFLNFLDLIIFYLQFQQNA
jgi:hypothetical protein